MDFNAPRLLGRTGLTVGRLGLAASFGAETEAYEEAFDRGCNYFYWGSIRRDTMRRAIINICARGKRDDLIIVLQTYSRSPRLMEFYVKKGLRALSLDAADVLLLGWHNKPPSRRIMDRALALKERGLVRFLGLSGHNRELFPRLADDKIFDLFHVRYNAAHRGAETEVFAKLQDLPDADRPGLVTYTATRWRHLLDPKKMPPGGSGHFNSRPSPYRLGLGRPRLSRPLQLAASAPDCYRFVLSHPAVDVAVCGAKNLEEMREDLRVLDLGPLGPEEMARMHKIGDHLHAHHRGFFG